MLTSLQRMLHGTETRALAIALLLLTAPATSWVGAQGMPNPVPPPPVLLNVPQVRQTTPVWCWLAVAEMAVRYRHLGRGLSQCQMGPPPLVPLVVVNDPMAHFPSEVPYHVLRSAWSAAIVVL